MLESPPAWCYVPKAKNAAKKLSNFFQDLRSKHRTGIDNVFTRSERYRLALPNDCAWPVLQGKCNEVRDGSGTGNRNQLNSNASAKLSKTHYSLFGRWKRPCSPPPHGGSAASSALKKNKFSLTLPRRGFNYVEIQ